MNDTAASSQCPPPEIKKNSNILLKLILLIVFLLFIIAAVVTKFIFAPWQEIPSQMPQPADFILQNKIIRKVMKEFSSKKQIRPEATLKLSVPEINSLLRLLGNIKPKNIQFPLRYFRPHVSKDGVFSATFPVRTSAAWLWGGTIYIRTSAEITKKQEGMNCKLKSLHLTSVPLPLQQAQRQIDLRLAKLKLEKNYKIFDQAIKSISFDGKKFVIIYRPMQMMMMLQNR